MKHSTIRVGLVGSGFIAKFHSLAYNNLSVMYNAALPGVERIRLFDVTSELAAAGASRLGWQGATDDWRNITRADDIDLVDIVAPNYAHAEIAIDAARHGKHIFCEKPLAHDVASARRMVEAVRQGGCVHQVGFVYRMWPAVAFAKELIDTGKIGRILHFHSRFLHDYGLDPSLPMSWRFESRKAGAGSIGDIGSHAIDIARYLVGDIVRVFARSSTFIRKRLIAPPGLSNAFRRYDSETADISEFRTVDVDDATDMLVEFEDGTVGNLETNWAAAGHENELSFEVSGDRGAIKFSWRHANELLVYSVDDPENLNGFRTVIIGPMHPEAESFGPVPGLGMGYGDAFLVALREMVESISCSRTASPNFLDGLRACEVVDAAVRSSASAEWEDVYRNQEE